MNRGFHAGGCLCAYLFMLQLREKIHNALCLVSRSLVCDVDLLHIQLVRACFQRYLKVGNTSELGKLCERIGLLLT